MEISGDIPALAVKIINASEVKRLYRKYQTSDPYTKSIPERIRRKYAEEKKASSKSQ